MSQKLLKRVKKEKKLKDGGDSDSGDSEHELFHYGGDRVQLMKEVVKILKPKKIKSLAPQSMKHLEIEEINAMLLEELLGISNKRLKKILDGQNAEDVSSSSSEDEGDKKIDVISLDDISEDEDFCFVDEVPTAKNKKDPKNDKSKNKKVKSEPKEEPENEKLLSVLELLELQARARAIKSQLALENHNKPKDKIDTEIVESDGEEDAVIIESPELNEIVISDSENDEEENGVKEKNETHHEENQSKHKTLNSLNQDDVQSLNEEKQNELNTKGAEDDDKLNENVEINSIPLPNLSNHDSGSKDKTDAKVKEEASNECKGKAKRKLRDGAASDSDDDVIRLEVVEIEGIDDC